MSSKTFGLGTPANQDGTEETLRNFHLAENTAPIKSPLLKLPQELRDHIYRYVLNAGSDIALKPVATDPKWEEERKWLDEPSQYLEPILGYDSKGKMARAWSKLEAPSTNKLDISILGVSKSIYKEAIEILNHERTFIADPYSIELKGSRLQIVTRIRMHFQSTHYACRQLEYLLKFLLLHPGVKKLEWTLLLASYQVPQDSPTTLDNVFINFCVLQRIRVKDVCFQVIFYKPRFGVGNEPESVMTADHIKLKDLSAQENGFCSDLQKVIVEKYMLTPLEEQSEGKKLQSQQSDVRVLDDRRRNPPNPYLKTTPLDLSLEKRLDFDPRAPKRTPW
jgi:hypothetical protein